jgi:hypothetical protein
MATASPPPLSQTPVQQSWIWDSQHAQEEQRNAQRLAQIEGSPSDDSVTEPESVNEVHSLLFFIFTTILCTEAKLDLGGATQRATPCLN